MPSGILCLLSMSCDLMFPRLPSALQMAISPGIGTPFLTRVLSDSGRCSAAEYRMNRQRGEQIWVCSENWETEKLRGMPKASSGLANKDVRTRTKKRSKTNKQTRFRRKRIIRAWKTMWVIYSQIILRSMRKGVCRQLEIDSLSTWQTWEKIDSEKINALKPNKASMSHPFSITGRENDVFSTSSFFMFGPLNRVFEFTDCS